MKTMTLILAVAVACGGGKKEEPKKEEPKVEEKKADKKDDDSIAGKFGSFADKAKDKAKEAADKAKEMGGEAADKAKEKAGEAVDKAKSIDFEGKAKEIGDEIKRKAVGLSEDAVKLGKALKDKLIAVHKASYDYDVTLEKIDSPDDKARGMKQLKIGDYAVGYKSYSVHPMGKVYNWQFQMSWKLLGGTWVRASLYTNEELAELALAALLADLVPAANLLLK